jgi:2-oxoisovalerate dehydrogenase E1 component
MTLSADTLEHLYQTMVRIRRFDEKTAELFQAGYVKGTAHSYVGQEAVAAGACAALRDDDYIVGNHRGHGHCLAKGARVDRMMAELMGRATGYCRGLGGSMHIAALDQNILGCNGIVAAGLPIGTGAALAARLRGTDQVVITFFGDGGANQGVVHEAMNLAAVWKLGVIFLCENNQYALSTATSRTTAGQSIAARAAGYGISGVRVDGNDVLAVHEAAQAAVTRARAGQGHARQSPRLPHRGGGVGVAGARSHRALRDPADRAGDRHRLAAQGAAGAGRDRAGPRGAVRQGQPRAHRGADGGLGLRAPHRGARAGPAADGRA